MQRELVPQYQIVWQIAVKITIPARYRKQSNKLKIKYRMLEVLSDT